MARNKTNEFGYMISSRRIALGYSQFQLGKLMKVSGKAVSKWENGDARPRFETVCRLSEILDVPLIRLLTALYPDQTFGCNGGQDKPGANRDEHEEKEADSENL